MIVIKGIFHVSYFSRPKPAIIYLGSTPAIHTQSVDDTASLGQSFCSGCSRPLQEKGGSSGACFPVLHLRSPDCPNCRDEGKKNTGFSSVMAQDSEKRYLATKGKVFASFAPLFVSGLNLAQVLVFVTIGSNWTPHQKYLIALC